jgi:hypothetical protein
MFRVAAGGVHGFGRFEEVETPRFGGVGGGGGGALKQDFADAFLDSGELFEVGWVEGGVHGRE